MRLLEMVDRTGDPHASDYLRRFRGADFGRSQVATAIGPEESGKYRHYVDDLLSRARCAYFAAVRLGLENHPAAIPALRRLVGRMDIVAFGPDRLPAVFDEIGRWPPRMDFADGCAVVLARSYDQAFVLTTDFRDFSTYGVPFCFA
jgi:hypothetical protein